MTKLGSLFLEPSVQGDMFILQIQMFTLVKLHLLCFVGILTTSLSLVQSMIFTCIAEGESRSRSAVTPSVCPSVCPSQNLVIATPLKLLIQLS